MSYYRNINGHNYDAALLDQAKALTKGQGDGRLSYEDAQALWTAAQDGPGLTSIEQQTFHYLLQHFNWTNKASQYLHQTLAKFATMLLFPFQQAARETYQQQRHAYIKAQFEAQEGNPWQAYKIDRVAPHLPEAVKEAFQYYYNNVEQADWGSVRVYQFPLEDTSFYAVETNTDGDDGWAELYDLQGQAIGFGRNYMEQVYWGEQATTRGYVQTGDFPPAANDRYDRNSW